MSDLSQLKNKIKQELNKLSREEIFEVIEFALKKIEENDKHFKAAYPLIYAHWYINPDGYYLQCSNCYEENSSKEDICPHCGAIMKEEE